MEVEISSDYVWDSKLELRPEEFDLSTADYDAIAAQETAFPSDYTLAIFAEQAYADKDYSLPRDWQLLTTAKNKGKRNGYYGVAFFNSKLCQVVIAHRGTAVSNPGALLSDVQLALKQTKTRQSQSAATFVYRISEKIKEKNKKTGNCIQLSITGHSLGAWLAQVTTFTVKYLKSNGQQFVEDKEYLNNIHTHTVVFESPGCKETMTKLVKIFVPRYSHRKFGNYDILDMTVYLSQLNPINSINQHVGIIYYAVHAKTHSIKEIRELFDPITHKIERKIVLDFQTGMYASCKLLMKNLLPISSTQKHFVVKPANENEYSLNVFTEEELDFVKDWFRVNKYDSESIQEFKHEYSLPDFMLDYEYNTIRAKNLQKAIACVKRLRPTKTIIFELLKNDYPDQYYKEILKLEVEHFQKNLLMFPDHCFVDKYDLVEFLKSHNQILNIRINKNSMLEYELETSILNNVITYYQEQNHTTVEKFCKANQYCFLNWNQLQKLKTFFPKIFGKGTDKVNLLVIEFFEASERAKGNMLQCINTCEAKIIILTTDECSWKEENNIQEVNGFGSNIQFQDLTEGYQRDLVTQQIFKLNEEKWSLSDIIDAQYPLSIEVYEYLNKAIPVQALLEHMLTPTTEIVMDCYYNNLISPVVFLDIYREIALKYLTNNYEDSLFIIQDRTNCISVEDKNILGKIGNQIVKIQNEVNFEKECLAKFNLTKMIYFIIAENGKFFLTKIFNRNFYVPRNIIHRRTVSSSIFDNVDIDQYYIIVDNTDKCEEMTSYIKNNRKEHFQFVGSVETTKQQMRNTKVNAHLLKIQNEKIFWLHSHGKMESLRKYMQFNESCVKEIDIIRKKITILSGEPGMGKSSTIGHLFLQLKQTHWVFVIPLKSTMCDNLPETVDFESAANFILKSCGIADINLLQHLLSYCLKNETKKFPIYLMFDGYDDIYETQWRKKFCTIINFLKDFSTANILITTRKYTCRELENEISVFASRYKALKEETEVKNFFHSICYSQSRIVLDSQLHILSESSFNERIEKLVSSILKNAHIIFGESISNFIGIPMQMRMLAEILAPLNPSDTVSMLVDIIGLYQKYIEMRYDIHFKRIGLLSNTTIKKWFSEHIFEKLYKLAIIKMLNTRNDSIDFDDIAELNKVGLIQSDSLGNRDYEFLHGSLRDYFIAYFIKQWLESYSEIIIDNNWDIVQFLVSDFLLKGEFKEMRFFVNHHLKNTRIISMRLELCQDKLQQIWQHNQALLFNNNQESIFHICVKENLYYLMKHFLLKIINSSNKIKLLSMRNADFETPLFLAMNIVDRNKIENILLILLQELNEWPRIDIKVVLLATLFTYYVSTNSALLDTLYLYSKDSLNVANELTVIEPHFEQITKFLDACKDKNLDQLNNILNLFQNDKITRTYFLSITNEYKETCLHLTSSAEIFERLLKLGANKNSQDHHGMTPLARAIKNGKTDIAAILIKRGTSFIGDYIGNSPLYHASKRNNLEIVKLLLRTKKLTKANMLNERNVYNVTSLMIAAKCGNEQIVQYLLDNRTDREDRADVLATDWNGMTALFHAVKGNCTKLVKTFRERGADIDVTDNNEITPLLHSIRKEHWAMVITLLDNGANINIRSGNLFPLKLLIQLNKTDIIGKVLTKMVKKTSKGTITREAANIEILSEDEKKYIYNLQNKKINK